MTALAIGTKQGRMLGTMPLGRFSNWSQKYAESVFLYTAFLPAGSAGASDLRTRFENLAAAWRQNTEFCSSLTDIVLDPSYQQIIGLGAA